MESTKQNAWCIVGPKNGIGCCAIRSDGVPSSSTQGELYPSWILFGLEKLSNSWRRFYYHLQWCLEYNRVRLSTTRCCFDQYTFVSVDFYYKLTQVPGQTGTENNPSSCTVVFVKPLERHEESMKLSGDILNQRSVLFCLHKGDEGGMSRKTPSSPNVSHSLSLPEWVWLQILKGSCLFPFLLGLPSRVQENQPIFRNKSPKEGCGSDGRRRWVHNGREE